MFNARSFRRIALAALASLTFAQGAVAAMGCATLRADAAQGNVAVMPSGELCDMLGSTPAPLCMKLFAQEAPLTDGDTTHAPALPVLPVLTVTARDAGALARFVRILAHPSILGPPPYLATLRLRV